MKIFKACTKCGKVWKSCEDFLELKDLLPLGFQAHFLDGNKSVCLFQHQVPNCQTTLAVPVILFADVIPGFIQSDDALFSNSCRGICLTDNRLIPCDHPYCRNALVRRFVQKLVKKKGMRQELVGQR